MCVVQVHKTGCLEGGKVLAHPILRRSPQVSYTERATTDAPSLSHMSWLADFMEMFEILAVWANERGRRRKNCFRLGIRRKLRTNETLGGTPGVTAKLATGGMAPALNPLRRR